MSMIDSEPPASSLDIHLKIHQDSSREEDDFAIAQVAQASCTMPRHSSGPDNDGTNACAFLCVQLHKVHEEDSVCRLQQYMVGSLRYCRENDSVINPHKDMEAYKIMRNCDSMIEEYDNTSNSDLQI